ncbi:MAG: hypothetical protein JNK37_01260 [Verrucomicrobiales bacterium]|nr:hypothetical protein [Verrucomicrobiales bacterium]
MNRRSFKSLLLAGVALVATAFTFAPAPAEAGSSCRSAGRCGSCGVSLRQELSFTGCYDRCGNPIYRWVTVSHSCRGSHHGHSHGYSSRSYRDYGYRSSSTHSYSRSYGYPSSGFSISINRGYPVSRYGCR